MLFLLWSASLQDLVPLSSPLLFVFVVRTTYYVNYVVVVLSFWSYHVDNCYFNCVIMRDTINMSSPDLPINLQKVEVILISFRQWWQKMRCFILAIGGPRPVPPPLPFVPHFFELWFHAFIRNTKTFCPTHVKASTLSQICRQVATSLSIGIAFALLQSACSQLFDKSGTRC